MADWRIENAKHTRNGKLEFKPYAVYREGWDHGHCEACTAKFSLKEPGALHEGYATVDNYRWICTSCFRELKDEMGWSLQPA